MNDLPDPLILVGGLLTIQDLAKQYASLKGWERVQVIRFPDGGSLAGWSQRTGQAVLEMSRPGDKIIIFLPEKNYQCWLKTLEAAGCLTEIPLCGLSIAQQIMTLQRWITALESRPVPTGRFARFLKKVKASNLFLKKHRSPKYTKIYTEAD